MSLEKGPDFSTKYVKFIGIIILPGALYSLIVLSDPLSSSISDPEIEHST
jgi:hypothetical protein